LYRLCRRAAKTKTKDELDMQIEWECKKCMQNYGWGTLRAATWKAEKEMGGQYYDGSWGSRL
jgi:hypothetical protein